MTNRNFDMTNFEQSLKDHADQFLIIPSKRIWVGLYNNLHPGSKWPSFAMGLVFILTLVSIGHLNNPESRRAYPINQISSTYLSDNSNYTNNGLFGLNSAAKNVSTFYWPSHFKFWKNGTPSLGNSPQNKKILADNANLNSSENSLEGIAYKNYNSNSLQLISKSEKQPTGKDYSATPNHFPSAKQVSLLYDKQNNKTSNSNNVNQEVFNNKDVSINFNNKEENGKIVWTYFITPSISSGNIPGITDNESSPSNSGSTLPKERNLSVMYNNQIGFETGTQIAFQFDEKWQFITGASLMYSGYQMSTNPVISENPNLTLQQGNSNNLSSVNNYKIQASIPFGVQYELWKNNDIQIKIASTIEPSFLITSDIYTLSPDGKSYVNSPDILRRVNLSGNFGSYISFGTKNIKWQIGPTIRYHILSNFRNGTSSGDHLIDYGIRIGISK